MKILAALVTALTFVSLGSAAFACEGFYKRSQQSAQDQTVLPPSDKKS